MLHKLSIIKIILLFIMTCHQTAFCTDLSSQTLMSKARLMGVELDKSSLDFTLSYLKQKSFEEDAHTQEKRLRDFTLKMLRSSRDYTELERYVKSKASYDRRSVNLILRELRKIDPESIDPREHNLFEYCFNYWQELDDIRLRPHDLESLSRQRLALRQKRSEISPRITLAVIEHPIGLYHKELSHLLPLKPLKAPLKGPEGTFVEIDNISHSAHVLSTLVGKDLGLLSVHKVKVFSTISELEETLRSQSFDPQNLLLINYSGTQSCPEVPEQLLQEIESLEAFILGNLQAIYSELSQEDQEAALAIKASVRDQLSPLLEAMEASSAKEESVALLPLTLKSLMTIFESSSKKLFSNCDPKILAEAKSLVQKNKEELISGMQEHYTKNTRAFLASLSSFFQKFPNSLLIQAIGNDGKCIDEDPLFKTLGETACGHFVLVENTRWERRTRDSNVTQSLAHSTLGAEGCHQISAGFLPTGKPCYKKESGTSMATPKVTACAAYIAQVLLEKTGSANSEAVRASLLNPEKFNELKRDCEVSSSH